jgi:hypothetical protein
MDFWMIVTALVFVGCLCAILAVGVAYWLQEPVSGTYLQPVPTVPEMGLPAHEVNTRTIMKLKVAEQEPRPLVDADFDAEGAAAQRKSRLTDLIRATQSNK